MKTKRKNEQKKRTKKRKNAVSETDQPNCSRTGEHCKHRNVQNLAINKYSTFLIKSRRVRIEISARSHKHTKKCTEICFTLYCSRLQKTNIEIVTVRYPNSTNLFRLAYLFLFVSLMSCVSVSFLHRTNGKFKLVADRFGAFVFHPITVDKMFSMERNGKIIKIINLCLVNSLGG